MTTNVKTSSVNLREIIARVLTLKTPPRTGVHYVTFSSNSTGRVELPSGWEPTPHGVYLNGNRQVEGVQYSVEFSGLKHTVVWVVPPSTSSYCQIDMEQQI